MSRRQFCAVDGRNLMALTNIKDANNHITSHLAYGLLRSDAIAVTANAQYDLYAWVRGKLDPGVDTGVSEWIMRVLFYNSSSGSLGSLDVDSGNPGTLSTGWQQEGGRFTTPSNTASVRIDLHNYLNSGWVAFDDVSFIKVGTGTNLAPNYGFESSGS
ncbi:MAG: hypothetical protein HND44_05445 [Chloroflexi bacterium]|nr:hypothetical protein [Ardenticatenaceae bacterium]MBL1127937.1 hypothetical protein [Chloroflexota bacterium]NOG34008.1 hypothetical protein [Chloroflexota bacterium]GIK54422.1 MAG: hypothetical protein BroJett015_00850 [Chloroflexota bacterium]